MLKKVIAIMLAVLMLMSIATAFVTAEAGSPVRDEEDGIVWDFEVDPYFDSCLPIDNDEDGFNWEWETGDKSHYEGSGYMFSSSSLNGTPLTPDNYLFIASFTDATSISFYANESREGDYHDVLAVWVSPDGGESWNEEFIVTLNGTEPTLYTVELGEIERYCLVAFRHYQCSGQADVVLDYVTAPGGVLYDGSGEGDGDDPYMPDDAIPLMSAEVEGLVPPQLGELASAELTVPEDAHYYIEDAHWVIYDEAEGYGESIDEYTAFTYVDGCVYYLSIELVPEEGYWFSVNADMSINGDESLVGTYSVYIDDGRLSLESVYFELEPQELEQISVLNINGFMPPVIGATAAQCCAAITVPENSGCLITRVMWWRTSIGWFMDDDEVFEEGEIYSLCVQLRPAAGYCFAEDAELLINGTAELVDEEASQYLNAQNVYIYSIVVEAVEGDVPAYGDVNGDGSIDTADAILAVRYMLELVELSPEQLAAADVDGDGEIALADAIFIVRYSLGIIDSFPIENRNACKPN